MPSCLNEIIILFAFYVLQAFVVLIVIHICVLFYFSSYKVNKKESVRHAMKSFSCIDAMMYTEHTNRKSSTDHGGFIPQFKQPIFWVTVTADR